MFTTKSKQGNELNLLTPPQKKVVICKIKKWNTYLKLTLVAFIPNQTRAWKIARRVKTCSIVFTGTVFAIIRLILTPFTRVAIFALTFVCIHFVHTCVSIAWVRITLIDIYNKYITWIKISTQTNLNEKYKKSFTYCHRHWGSEMLKLVEFVTN